MIEVGDIEAGFYLFFNYFTFCNQFHFIDTNNLIVPIAHYIKIM